MQIQETIVQVKIPGIEEATPLKTREKIGDRPIDFGEYALTKKDLSDFLTTYGPEWGYYQSKGDSFIRWLMRN